MIARALVSKLGFCLLIAIGCGKSDDSTPGGSAGQATSGSAGSAGAAAGAGAGAGASGGGGGGSSGASGAGTGGTVSGTAGQNAVGGHGEAGASSEGGTSSEGLVDCDARKIVCKRAAPNCGAMEVPSVEGTCYGECVKIDRCTCSAAAECPDANQYTCWMSKHCGPYVN